MPVRLPMPGMADDADDGAYRGSEDRPFAVEKLRLRYSEETERVTIVFRFQLSICSLGVSLEELEQCGAITIETE